MSDLLSNARNARHNTGALDQALIVTGDHLDAKFWDAILSERQGSGSPKHWVERGKKGNLLGALQAYSAARREEGGEQGHGAPPSANINQIHMLFGSGTRLSPFTQALRNIKAAFPLPDADRGSSGLTIGEAAMRAAGPLISCLHEAGFSGVVFSWGDEVLLPSRALTIDPAVISETDVVRFGWRKDPNRELASQKEWLQVDIATGAVVQDISRQPLDRLATLLRSRPDSQMATYVNLGSFAATHDFLSAACDAFGGRVDDSTSAANWDPYFWQALQCPSRESWNQLVRYEKDAGLPGLQALLTGIPDFYEIVQRFRVSFEHRIGRPLRISIFDFGEPYWIDAGNHVALSRAFSDLFSASEPGATIRAFLGLPDSLANGGSFVKDSRIPVGCSIENSIVIGTSIRDERSAVEGAVILGSNIGQAIAAPGTAAVWCHVEDLSVQGPNGIAFRLDGKRHELLGNESATTLLLPDRVVQLKYSRAWGGISNELFETRLADNPLSFAEAASLIRAVDPIELYRSWATMIGMS
jgi:hypothetical protein